ncbi:hypothetical protein MMC07_008774 [Pseudocyphellaria aurata]|nr:hypothetical protein [Pseudocyphellaria aurata]
MLNAVRHGPVSVARSLLSPSSSSRCVKLITARSPLQITARILPTQLNRAISTTPQWTQRAVARAEEEEYEVEEQIDAQRPPSNSQINEAVQRGPVTSFKDLETRNMVCRTVVNTITQDMGLETMTQVQSLTINETLKGIDVLAQARTGTGKTMAFLIPVLQNIIKVDPKLEFRRERYKALSMDIRAIIISPTRELAEQIAREAEKICKNTGVVVQTAVGGSSKQMGLQKIRREGCHILVGTPGRLNDLLSDPYSKIQAPNLSAFVLDEADRLLDDGFGPEVEAIQSLLPARRDVDRQTLLFSATVPNEIMGIVRATMKPDFKFVRTVQEGEQQTHEKVPQKLITVRGMENYLPALVELCKRETARSDQDFKAIVYFNATAEVRLANATLSNLRHGSAQASSGQQHPLYPLNIFEIHAKLTQAQRTWAATKFRSSKQALLLSSDVTARGMDFPGVTHVIQFGIPSTRDMYIHRIGRTARADKGGEGWLFLSQIEAQMGKSRLYDLPLKPDTSLEAANVDMTKDASLPESLANTLTQVVEATKNVPFEEKAAAYKACLGSLAWHFRKQDVVDAMNDRCRYLWGMATPPPVNPMLVTKLGFRGVSGLNTSGYSGPSDGAGGSRYGGSGSSFGTRGGYQGGGSSYGHDNGAPRSGGYGDRGGLRSGGYGDRGAPRTGGYGDRGVSRPDGYGDRGPSRSGGYGERQSGGYGERRSGGYGDRGGQGRGSGRSGGYGRGRESDVGSMFQ